MSNTAFLVAASHGFRASAATGVPLTLTRLDETTSGEVLVSNGVPLQPGAYTLADAQTGKGRIAVGGVEREAYIVGIGRHPDGSYRSALVQFLADPDSEPVAVLDLAGVPTTSRAYTTVAFFDATTGLPPDRVLNDPRKAGQPAACALPTDPAYLMATNIAGPGLCTVAEAAALPLVPTGRTKETGAYADICDQRFDYYQRDYHLAGLNGGSATSSLAGVNIANYPDPSPYFDPSFFTPEPQPSGWTGDEPPAYGVWRARLGQPTSLQSHFAAYGGGLTFFQRWARTGDIAYWRLGCAIIWSQVYFERWSYSGTSLQRNLAYLGYVSMDLAGTSSYYLTTGDPEGLDLLIRPNGAGAQGWAFQSYVTYNSGATPRYTQYADFYSSLGEARPVGRELMARLEAWRCTRPGAENHPLCSETKYVNPGWFVGQDMEVCVDDAVTRILTGTARCPDGVWRDKLSSAPVSTPGVYCNTDPASARATNTFMEPLVLHALVAAYEDGPSTLASRADIPGAVKQCIDTLISTYWDISRTAGWEPAFRNWFSSDYNGYPRSCSVDATWDESVPLTGMYPFAWAWYAYRSGDATYADRARQLLAAATGEGAVNTLVDGQRGPYPAPAQKLCHEHFCHLQPALGWLNRAGR